MWQPWIAQNPWRTWTRSRAPRTPLRQFIYIHGELLYRTHSPPSLSTKRLFTWHAHNGRCRGDARFLHAHEFVMLAIKRMALCNPNPHGVAIPSSQLQIQPKHMQSNDSRLGDLIYPMAGGHSVKADTKDVMISSSISMSNLLHSSTSLDYTLRHAENVKLTKDLRVSEPIHTSITQRLISLVMNQCGNWVP